jgi:DNA-binding MarR family transcriptional regulator
MRHEERLIHAQWQLGKALVRALDTELEELGITMPQFGVLNAVAVDGALSGADLARRQDVRPQTMAATLTALVDADLVERRPHPVHGRVLLVDLTSSGREIWRAARDRVGRVERRLRVALGDQVYDEIRTQTWKLVDVLGGDVVSQPPYPMR